MMNNLQIRMPPDIVVRPSGVWNSRAPFHNFWLAHQQQNKSHHLLTLSILRTQHDAGRPGNAGKALRRFFQTRDIGLIAENALLSYRKSQPVQTGGVRQEPSVVDLPLALQQLLYEIRQSSAVRYVSLFETFVLCWALNFLLAKLENAESWSSDERKLAVLLSPIHSKTPPPGWPLVAKQIALIGDGLRQLPHVFRDPETKTELSQPVTSELNAFTAMMFWRDFRNTVVHRGAIISSAFVAKYGPLYDQIRKPFANRSRPLMPGEALAAPEAIVRSMMTTHYKAARWINEILVKVSKERRGHIFAPNAIPESGEFTQISRPPPLLIQGDHAPSLAYVQSF